MSEEKKLEFDFPEMGIKEDELNRDGEYKNKEAYEETIKESGIEDKNMLEEIKSAMEAGKESGEILSEKTKIDDSNVAEIYKGLGMAAGVTIGVGKVTKTLSQKVAGKIFDKLSEKVIEMAEEKKKTDS